MSSTQDRLILWVGEKHSGKTTGVAGLVKVARAEGFNAAGVLAPSLYDNGRLMGFDVLNLRDGSRAPLARRRMDAGKMSPFVFINEGVRLGNAALRQELGESADLVIVDEFGPLELSGKGWRSSVDSLLTSINTTMLLVVRREMVNLVQRVYADFHCWIINAAETDSVNKIICALGRQRRLLWGAT
ncbi:nucleoside-triphosphatase [Planctomycetota bacterium]